jgi:flagellar FliJ protein
MRRFRFSLQRVLDYRESVEKKMLAELAVIQADLDREVAYLQELIHARNCFQNDMREHLKKSSSDEIKHAYVYLDSLNNCISSQKCTVEHLSEARNRKLEEVMAAAKERKILERLKDHKKREHTRTVERLEQAFLDDIAGVRHSRLAKGIDTGVPK